MFQIKDLIKLIKLGGIYSAATFGSVCIVEILLKLKFNLNADFWLIWYSVMILVVFVMTYILLVSNEMKTFIKKVVFFIPISVICLIGGELILTIVENRLYSGEGIDELTQAIIDILYRMNTGALIVGAVSAAIGTGKKVLDQRKKEKEKEESVQFCKEIK